MFTTLFVRLAAATVVEVVAAVAVATYTVVEVVAVAAYIMAEEVVAAYSAYTKVEAVAKKSS